MTKVTYYIDDLAWFKDAYKGVSFDGWIDPFKCKFSLIGEKGKIEERYELVDMDGREIDINSLNGYQKGVVLADCYRHFEGGQLESETDMPVGVVCIEEEVVDE